MTIISTERLEEMRPCPFCGVSLVLTEQEEWVHPWDDVCPAEDIHIHHRDEPRINAWNRRSLDKGEVEPVGKFVTQVSAIDALNDRFYADEDTSPQPNKGEVVELVKKLRLWSETPYEGDPMVDALLGDAADAMSAILSLQRELREARMQALASDGQAQEAWEERGRVENERNQMARDWSEFCEAIGMAVDAHEVVAEAVGAKFAEYALVSQPAPKGGEITHPDDLAVDRFASAMKAKLAKKRAEGRGGWDLKDECSAEFLSQLLREHVEKGDPVDVGNLAMMLQQRGERITK